MSQYRYLSKPCLCKTLCNFKCIRKHTRPVTVTVMYMCSFITHLDGTRKWTGCHPVWMEFLYLSVSLSFEEVVSLLVSSSSVSLLVYFPSWRKQSRLRDHHTACIRVFLVRRNLEGSYDLVDFYETQYGYYAIGLNSCLFPAVGHSNRVGAWHL